MKPKDEQILTALLSCGSVVEASNVSKVSCKTIYNRLSDKEFKAEYDHRRTTALNEACAIPVKIDTKKLQKTK